MIYISHRGNYQFKNIKTENTIDQINYCLSLGINVEIDVWHKDSCWWLGHDYPCTKIAIDFLMNPNLWCHAKNYEALFNLIEYNNIHCFWHDTDLYTLTSKKFIWAYPGAKLDKNSICVLPELSNYSQEELQNCAGICSDKIAQFII